MFWKKGAPVVAPQSELGDPNQSQPLDPAIEEKRLQSLTGNKTIVIARKGDSKVKLPGL